MNATNVQHALSALVIQVLFGLAGLGLGDGMAQAGLWIGAAAGSGFYIGREITQAEYRWIEAFGRGKRINMPWWGPVDPRVWTHLDSWLDFLAPTVAVLLMAILLSP